MRGPDDFPGREVQPLHPAVDSELAARWPNDHAIARDKRRHRCRLTLIHVGDLRLPKLLATLGVDRDGVSVQQVVDDLAVSVDRAAVDRVATGNTDGCGVDVGPVLPFERIAFAREIEGVENIWERCDDVHRVAEDERLAFMAAEDTGRKAPDRAQPSGVARRDLRQAAVARRRIIFAGHRPLPVVANRCSGTLQND